MKKATAISSSTTRRDSDGFIPEKSKLSNELQQLMPKLRPFQREAYEFATQGILSSRLRQQQQLSSTRASGSSAKFEPSASDDFQYDPNLLGKGRILLSDEPGLGKSVTALAIMAHYIEEWPLLIMCPASLRHMWPAEIEKFLPSIPPSSIYVCSGYNDVAWASRKDIRVVVATYSLLQNRSAAAKLLGQCHFKAVIADESHNLKQKNSQRSQLALPLLQKAKRLLLLSGTPALARPVELWLQLHALAPALFGTYTNYTQRYCDAKRKFGHWDVSGLSNARELHARLKKVMVRRLKCDVLHELPPKQRSIVTVSIADKKLVQQSRELMTELSATRLSISELMGEAQRNADFEARKLLMQAYQASGMAKVQAVADYLLDWVAGSGTQKVLMFAHHKGVLDVLELALSKHLKGVGHIRIDGSVPANDRARLVRKFQTTSQVRVGLLSMTAAGVGLTLTAATTVMFAELHWTPGVLAQAEDRCHRIGQANSVNIMYFVCKDRDVSVDSQLWDMLARKVGNLERVIDGGSGKEKSALAATTVDGKIIPRQSVQEELSKFFADTAADSSDKKASKVPVKGSIMSFFKKTYTSTRKGDDNLHDNNGQSSATSTTASAEKASGASENSAVAWDCEACSFKNSRKPTARGYLACEICRTPYYANFAEVQPVTPMPIAGGLITKKSRLPPSCGSVVISLVDSPEQPQEMARRSLTTPSSDRVKSDGQSASETPLTDLIDNSFDESPGSNPHSVSSRKSRQSLSESPSACMKEILEFSVSKNSGRISLHYKDNGKSSLVNFDMNMVVTEETVDRLSEANVKRTQTQTIAVPIAFEDSRVMAIVKQLDRYSAMKRRERKECCREVKEFVTNYVALREVEKKALKDSRETFQATDLRRNVVRIMTGIGRDAAKTTTERYSGGSKERAEERLREGSASETDLAVLRGDNCAWCAGALSTASKATNSIYCSQDCTEAGRIRRGGGFASKHIRDQLYALEGGVCQLCRVDAHSLFLRIQALAPAQRLSVLCDANWTLPKSKKGLDNLLHDPKEGSFWQADHITAVAEGGGSCGLENLRTLCVPCHAKETERLRARLRLTGGGTSNVQGADSSQQDGPKRKQLDIRALFGNVRSGKRHKQK